MKTVEILAPAGSLESVYGSVKAGADAVYIGGMKFGARAFADNPNEEELLDAIDFVHLNGKKIYMTVNTLFKENELKNELVSFLAPYYERGVDAVIVQDIGALSVIKNVFPDLPVHASTQMTIASEYGCRLLSGLGNVTRVVPARELSISEIRSIRENTDLELECFVHGALCYSYSGQCLFSSVIGGRSGNRGRCAQPCRMKYDLFEDGKFKKNGYLLSLKDLCTLEYIPDLIDAGIDSFKIEGRMKRPEYTAGIAGLYRTLADMYLDLGKDGYENDLKLHPDIMEKAMKTAMELYNRGGFTKGYYFSYHGKDMMTWERPNHTGIPAGYVTSISGRRITVKEKEVLSAGDVLEIKGKEPFEFTVGKEMLRQISEDKNRSFELTVPPDFSCLKGAEVIRTKNATMLLEISEKYLGKKKQAGVTGVFKAEAGKAAELELSLSGTAVTVYGDTVTEAVNKPVTEKEIRETLNKTGESEFRFESITVEAGENIFIPVGKIKELRRAGFEKLKESVLNTFRRKAPENLDFPEENETLDEHCTEKIAAVTTKEQLQVVLSSDVIDTVYLDMQELKISSQVEFLRQAEEAGKAAYLMLPYVFRKKDIDRYKKELEDDIPLVVNSLDSLEFARSKSKKIRLSENLYVMNSVARQMYSEIIGFKPFTVMSVELNEAELKDAGSGNSGLVIYGRSRLMYTAQCLSDNYMTCLKKSFNDNPGLITLKDRTGAEFPVRRICTSCMNVIYNSAVYSIIGTEEEKEIKACAHIFEFSFEKEDEVKRVLDAYKNGKELKGNGYTKGHIRRGVV